MLLIELYPAVAFRDCQHCLEHIYDEATGEPLTGPNKQPRKRINGVPPPMCQTPVGCPKGTPEQPKTMTPENEQAFWHYKQCKATGRFPDDPLVAENAAIIADMIEFAAEERANRERTKAWAKPREKR